MTEMEVVCEKLKIKAEVTYGGEVPKGWTPGTSPWRVTLRFQGRRMTVPFFTGPAISREPSAADVLSCLVSDASSVENARDFEDWCGDLGFDTDSRKAESTYRACERIAKRLRVFLGDSWNEIAGASH